MEGKTGLLGALFGRGVTMGLLNFTRIVIFTMFCFFCIWPMVDYNVHYVVMAALSFCLFVSFEFFTYHLKKNPEIMNPKTD